MRKSILAVIVAAVSVASVSANAANVNDVFDAVNSHRLSFKEFSTVYQSMTVSEQSAFKAVEQAHGINYTQDLPNATASAGGYARNQTTAQRVESTPHIDAQQHYTSEPGAHLDGNHAAFTVDHSSHLDGNVTDAQRIAAQVQAQVKDGVNGKDGVDGKRGLNGVDGKKGATGEKGESITGKRGANGSNGLDGKDGKDADQAQVNSNSAAIIAHSRVINNHATAIDRNSAAIANNSKRIDRNSKDIAANRKAIKQVGAMAAASANLHYNVNHNGYAVAAGEYNGATAIAGGVQFQTGEHTAVTLQASYDGEAVGASVGFHGDF